MFELSGERTLDPAGAAVRRRPGCDLLLSVPRGTTGAARPEGTLGPGRPCPAKRWREAEKRTAAAGSFGARGPVRAARSPAASGRCARRQERAGASTIEEPRKNGSACRNRLSRMYLRFYFRKCLRLSPSTLGRGADN